MVRGFVEHQKVDGLGLHEGHGGPRPLAQRKRVAGAVDVLGPQLELGEKGARLRLVGPGACADEFEQGSPPADLAAFLIDHAYVIPFGFGNGGYVASRIDPFTSQFAPYGFTNERYKGSEILSEPMDTDAYFDAYDQWIEDRASQTK